VSDTEVHATYPVLAAGNYVIALNSGAIPFIASIVAVPPTNYSHDSIVLPEQPAQLSFLRYDAERNALLAGGFYFRWANITNKLWRYTHDGLGWGAAQTVDVAGLNDAVLVADGSRLLAVADAGVVELSTADLSILRTTPKPGPGGTGNGSLQLYGIAIANNGMALIRGGSEGWTARIRCITSQPRSAASERSAPGCSTAIMPGACWAVTMARAFSARRRASFRLNLCFATTLRPRGVCIDLPPTVASQPWRPVTLRRS